jgi:hypothetical protein
MDDLTKKEQQPSWNEAAWEEYGKAVSEAASKQQPLTLERFMRNCSSGVRSPTKQELAAAREMQSQKAREQKG